MYIQNMITNLIYYIRGLRWKFLIGLALLALVAAIVNNIRVPSDKSVTWIGGQKILEKPE